MLRVVTSEPTRRRILELALATQAVGIAAAQEHAAHQTSRRDGNAKLESLTKSEAAEIEALAALIIPSPGAREAGVIHFIDKALATFDRDKRDAYRDGLRMLAARRTELFPSSTTLAALSGDEQLELVLRIENTEFFELVRVHTIIGFPGAAIVWWQSRTGGLAIDWLRGIARWRWFIFGLRKPWTSW